MLLALGDYTRAKIVDDVDYNKATTSLEKLSRRYLTNEDETGDTYYKVRLNEEDFYAWMKLLENRTKPDDIKRSKIFENYRIIYKALCDSDVEPQLVLSSQDEEDTGNGVEKQRRRYRNDPGSPGSRGF